MNIIELAKEAGFIEDANCEVYGSYYHLERFAALVKAEREWVDLTDREARAAFDRGGNELCLKLRAAIAAFKEKNR